VCLNVDDASFPGCTSSDVTSFTVIACRPASAEIDALAAAVAAAAPIGDERCYFSDGMRVPVKVTEEGKRKVGRGKLRVRTSDGAEEPRTDTDKLKMRCRPAS
jgi:hypothetical protein